MNLRRNGLESCVEFSGAGRRWAVCDIKKLPSRLAFNVRWIVRVIGKLRQQSLRGQAYAAAQSNRVDIRWDGGFGTQSIGSYDGAVLGFSGDVGPRKFLLGSILLGGERGDGLSLSISANDAPLVVLEAIGEATG